MNDIVTLGAFVTVAIMVIGVIGQLMRIHGKITSKAEDDGERNARLKEVEKDIDGIGKKVNALQIAHNDVSDRVIGIEKEVYSELKHLTQLMEQHISDHNRRGD